MARLACRGCVRGVHKVLSKDDEPYLVFECPAFEGLRREHRHLFDSEVAFDVCRCFAHKDQHGVKR